MKTKFSLRRLFIITTVIAVVLGICLRLDLFKGVNFFVVMIGSYCFVYSFIFLVFFGPRYWRQWKEFRMALSELTNTRLGLESEVQKRLAERTESDDHQDQSPTIQKVPRLPKIQRFAVVS